MIPLALALIGCGGLPATSFAGDVAGHKLADVSTAYFGGPFMIFTDVPLDCMEVAWVTRYYDDTQAPTDTDLTGLQLTFFEDNVITGRFDLAGDAAVGAELVVISGGDFTSYRAREGTLTVDEVQPEESAYGSLDLDFGDDGTLSADWAAEWCVNVSE